MAAVALTAALVFPIHAHSNVELADWQSGWTDRMLQGETPKLIAEFLDMSERHPCQLVKCPEVRVAARVVREATPPPNIGGGVEQWRAMVATFWPAEHVDRMLRIMACESGGNPAAHNPSGATGLFQIMPFWQKTWPGDYTDPWTNAAVAYQIWLSQGYGAWVCKG